MRLSICVAVALFTAACSSPAPDTGLPTPTQSTVRLVGNEAAVFYTEKDQNSAILLASPAEVWATLPAVYEQVGIPVSNVAPDLMALGNQGFQTNRVEGKLMSRYLDCGATHSGLLANIYDVTLSVTTRVVDGPEGGSVVSTTIDAWAEPRLTSGNSVHCTSKGRLEERLMEVLTEKLKVGAHWP